MIAFVSAMRDCPGCGTRTVSDRPVKQCSACGYTFDWPEEASGGGLA